MNTENRTLEVLDIEIAQLKSSISSLSEALPYADGQAYYNDQRRISELRAKLASAMRDRALLNNASGEGESNGN